MFTFHSHEAYVGVVARVNDIGGNMQNAVVERKEESREQVVQKDEVVEDGHNLEYPIR